MVIDDVHGIDCTMNLAYEWRPQVCSLCKRIDHPCERCLKKGLLDVTKKTSNPNCKEKGNFLK